MKERLRQGARMPALVTLLIVLTSLTIPHTTRAEELTAGDWTTSATAASTVDAGESIVITVQVTAAAAAVAIVDLEVYDPSGRKVFQRPWIDARFAVNEQRRLSTTWTVPPDAAPGDYVVKVGIFGPAWASLAHWNDNADIVEVTVSAPTTTEPPTPTTTTVVVPTPTTAPTTTAPASSPRVFSEDFGGNSGLERFRTGVFHRERDAFVPSRPDWVSTRPWRADHNIHLADCGDPNTNHHEVSTAQGDDASLYVCRDHMMTTMGDVSGYSVVWFSPDQTFDGISEVCWDVSVASDVLRDRKWWEVMVAPVSAPDVTAISWLAPVANVATYGQAGAVVLGFGPDNPPVPKISMGDAEPVRHEWPILPAWGAAFANVATRVPHCFRDLGNGTVEYETTNADGTAWSFTAPGRFPSGPVKVVFKDHNYTPDKACGVCASYTWHWDNIRVA